MKRSLSFVYAAFVLRYVYPLVLVPFYARVLGVSEYGRLLTANSLTMVVWGTLDYGFQLCGARDAASAANPKDLASIYGRHLSGRLTMLVPALALGAAGTFTSPVLSERPFLGLLATLAGVVASLNLGWYFQGTLRFVTSVVLEMLGLVLSLPLMLWLVRDDASVVVWISIATSVVVTVISHVVAMSTLDRAAVRIRGGISLVREATPLFAHRGFGILLQSGAIYIVSFFANAKGAGLYGSAEKLVGLGISAMAPANQVMLGTVSRRLAEGGDLFYQIIRKAMLVTLAVSICACLGALLLTQYLVPIALGPGYEDVTPLIKVLAFILPFYAMNQVMGSYVLVPLRHDAIVSTGSLLSLLVALPLTVLLVSQFGLLGASCARVLAEACTSSFLAFTLHRKNLWSSILSGGHSQNATPA